MGIVSTTKAGWFLFKLGTASFAAAVISFAVADYFVDRNTKDLITAIETLQNSAQASNAEMLEALSQINSSQQASLTEINSSLQGSLDLLDSSIRANTEASASLSYQMSEFGSELERQGARLVSVQTDVGNLQDAVQKNGIDIKTAFSSISEDGLAKTMWSAAIWSDVAQEYGIDKDSPILIFPNATYQE